MLEEMFVFMLECNNKCHELALKLRSIESWLYITSSNKIFYKLLSRDDNLNQTNE